MSRIRAWLDASPIADLALTFMREATGRTDPIEPLRPTRPAALVQGRRVAFWSLVGGVGGSTTAGLVAHRSAAGGRAPLLVDLDRWAPSLALRARIEAATIADALVQPGREHALVSRWSAVPFLPGSAALRGRLDIERATQVIRVPRVRSELDLPSPVRRKHLEEPKVVLDVGELRDDRGKVDGEAVADRGLRGDVRGRVDPGRHRAVRWPRIP